MSRDDSAKASQSCPRTEAPKLSSSSLHSVSDMKDVPVSGKRTRNKSSRRTEARRAYQRRRNQKRRDDAKKFRDLELRVARIEEDSKKTEKNIVIVLQDRTRSQVATESVSASVSVSESVSASASALASGAHRLTNGNSRCVTTSAADKDTEMELIVDDASGNAVVTRPSTGVDSDLSGPDDVARLKSGVSPFVTSIKVPTCHQQQSIGGVDRLKTGNSPFVTTAAGAQQRLSDANGVARTSDRLRSDDAEPRLKASSLVTTRASSKSTSCSVVDSQEHDDVMDCDTINNEDGLIVEENEVSVLSGFFPKQLKGYFTQMLSHSKLEFADMTKIEFEHPDVWRIRQYMNWRKYTEACSFQDTFINRRRYYLSRKPYIAIDSRDNKDEYFLSALINCHTFNDKYMTVFYCPCNTVHRKWKENFCYFSEEIKKCESDFVSARSLFKHCEEKGRSCRWHNLCYEFMKKVFFKNDDNFISDIPNHYL